MEPRIQYARTADGVSIAYWTLGEGLPLVVMSPALWDHIQMEWQDAGERSWLSRLMEKRTVIRYDNRGSGLSDREIIELSLDSLVLDLETVVDHQHLERFALWAPLFSGPVAIAYAARHPDRVSHLLLWCTFARTPTGSRKYSSRLDATASLVDKDWELFTHTWANVLLGLRAGDKALELAEFMRESLTPETAKAYLSVHASLDVSELLSAVTCPTLVLHRRQYRFVGVPVARSLASRIPNARLALLEGTSMAPYLGDGEAVASAIDEFLGEGEEAEAGTGLAADVVHTILFTDVEGSTALTQRLGDAKARELLREHERIVREALKAHGGSEVKALGDGFMTSFYSAVKALECAIAMQRAFVGWNQGVGAQGLAPLLVRIGLNAGEPIAEDDPDGRSDLYGTAVNEAARITATAKGGEILVSNVVRELAKGKDFLFADRGETSLKGFDEPVRLYEVRWRPDPADPQQ